MLRRHWGINPCFNGRYSQSRFGIIIKHSERVLILVLMEDTLREDVPGLIDKIKPVLILVLMEDTLRAFQEVLIKKLQPCINPCFNGRYSQRLRLLLIAVISVVLILVLMEDTLRVISTKRQRITNSKY